MEPTMLSSAGGFAALILILFLIDAVRKWLENRGVIDRNDFGYYELTTAECDWCGVEVDPEADYIPAVEVYLCDECWTNYENSVR